MKKSFIYLFVLALSWMTFSGRDALYAQFIQNTSRSLFSDVKAFQTGDALMVLIVEDTQADNNAVTNDSRETGLGGSAGAGLNNNTYSGDASLSTNTTHKASGQTKRNETIRSKISARVIEVDAANGNLTIEGKRTTKINGETQTIVIKGIVRPVDVTPSNSVYSYNILDLTLMIEGDGSVSKIQEPGLIIKFLRFLF